jgi:hypothetical protein
MLATGHTVPVAQSDAYDRKFAEYLERSKARWLAVHLIDGAILSRYGWSQNGW